MRAASRSKRASQRGSTARRLGSASCQAMISLAPWENGTAAAQPGTRRLINVLSKIIELALSPSREAPNSESTPAMTCDGTCTYRGSAPPAAAIVA